MKNKKMFMYIGIILILLILLGIGYLIYNNIRNKNNDNILEYIPQEEITEEQLRQTVITLYFLNPDTYELMPEARQIDVKELLNNPCEILINLLISGPRNEKLIKLIPEETKLNNVEIKNDILYINFSEEFIREQNIGEEQERLIIKSVINTLTELTEINKIKLLIDGQENLGFPDGGVKFDTVFVRE